MTRTSAMVAVLLAVAMVAPCTSFSVVRPSRMGGTSWQLFQSTASSDTAADRASTTSASNAWIQTLIGTRLNVTLAPHRPLGCVVEESLAASSRHVVFVASVHDKGHAARAGVQAGDVIVGVTGLFGDVQTVQGQGMEIVKQLVSSCPDAQPLHLQLLRGTTVFVDHEAALTELCANPDTSDAETEQCVLEYLQGGYDDTLNNIDNVACDETEQECLLDSMQSLWANDWEAAPTTVDPTPSAPVATTKPWSVRTSPSGTFVRDPATGQMRNIG